MVGDMAFAMISCSIADLSYNDAVAIQNMSCCAFSAICIIYPL
jgi:hypothetical protein